MSIDIRISNAFVYTVFSLVELEESLKIMFLRVFEAEFHRNIGKNNVSRLSHTNRLGQAQPRLYPPSRSHSVFVLRDCGK